MTKQANKELNTLKSKAVVAQAKYDAARSAVDDGEAYAKNLETEYREALANPTDFDRLTDLQAKRNAVGTVLADLQGAFRVVEDEKDDADDKLRHETKLQQALEELSPKAQALIQAWKADKLPSRVKLSSGEFSLPNLVGDYVDRLRRGTGYGVQRELESIAERISLET
jgi:chromosome segregation ATPase